MTSYNKIVEDARLAAQHEVEGFVLHDRKDYSKGAVHFSLAYEIINRYRQSPVSKKAALEAGVYKMNILRAYDTIVDDPKIQINHSDTNVRNYPSFEDVVHNANKECREFGLPEEYGRKKVEWYMEHAEWVKGLPGTQTNLFFLNKLKDADRMFVETVTGDSNLAQITWPIYLACVLLHDMPRISGSHRLGSHQHNEQDVYSMIVTYSSYLTILFSHKLNKNR